jgi:pimeloyl-ACP methyl ester carboxylesterase
MQGRTRRAPALLCGLALAAATLAACTSASGQPPPPATTATPTVLPTLEPEGQVIVKGKTFVTRCAGQGPSVILHSGYASPMESWDPVQARIAAGARTCTYDRLGVGRSDSPPDIQDFGDLAAQLDGVVTRLKLPRPVVVVAHSMGGPLAYTWAAQHPRDVRAMVLLDPPTPPYETWFLTHLPKPDVGNPDISNLLRDVARDRDPRTNRESLDPKAMDRVARLPVVDVPIRIIEAGRDEGPVPGMDGTALHEAWAAGHRWLAGRSTDGTVVVSKQSTHYVQGDDPDLVVKTVAEALK